MFSTRRQATYGFLVAIGLAFVGACGGGSTSNGGPGPSPTPPPSGGGGGGGTSTTTITIANNAVSPKTITVPRGTQVTFVNNDTQAHDMNSDPHPIHTDCPEINQVGFLVAGQSKQTGALNIARTCGYHDHNQDTVESLKGSIVIQ
jgi:plastocyanin